ncbi:glycosyltransferase family 2 protein [Candidatus Saccharibacteria bacterium]|nr:glycosyltransferase family 2 protein [Candidatus Saccharibacteria bacterium]
MKLFIQVPCLNEEKTLGLVLESIPKKITGIDQIEVLVIDDGSSDDTIDVAKYYGVKHFVKHKRNMGLARSFHDGVDYALKHGADIVVNTDGDNQYPQSMIGELVKPIIDLQADIVIGDRQTAQITDFSGFKKIMQRFGSWLVNQAAQTDLPDAASGFRAYSRYSLYRINIITEFSYCMETIIQAGNKHLKIVSIPITTNPKTRESRLFKNIWQHMFKSASAILRSYIMFHSKKVFGRLAIIFLILGGIPFIRYALYTIQGKGDGHLQSLIFGSTMLIGSLLSVSLLIIADMLQTNRTLTEDQLERIKKLQYEDQ